MRLEKLRGLDPDRLGLLQVRAFPLEEPWVRVRLRALPWVRVRLREEEEWALLWGLPGMVWGHRVNLEKEMVRDREGKGKRALAERARAPAWEEVRKERGMGSEEERRVQEPGQRREREPGQRREREPGRERRERVRGQRRERGQGQRREREPGREHRERVQGQRREREPGREHRERVQGQRRERGPGHQPVLPWGRKGNG